MHILHIAAGHHVITLQKNVRLLGRAKKWGRREQPFKKGTHF
jgi:hypothetical protein